MGLTDAAIALNVMRELNPFGCPSFAKTAKDGPTRRPDEQNRLVWGTPFLTWATRRNKKMIEVGGLGTVIVGGAIILAPATGGGSLGALAFVP
jgi:hypothetical protein